MLFTHNQCFPPLYIMYIILYWCEAQQTSSKFTPSGDIWCLGGTDVAQLQYRRCYLSLQHNLSCWYQPVHIKSTIPMINTDIAIYTRRLVETQHASSWSTLLYNMIMSTDTMYQFRKILHTIYIRQHCMLLDTAVTIEQRCTNRATTPLAPTQQ